MPIPQAEDAIIDERKLRDYLLNTDHRRGGSKARLFNAFGYKADDWQRLESDIRDQHLSQEADRTSESPYGTRYEIAAELHTPSDRELLVRSIWQIDSGTTVPRFITMYPE